MWNYAMDSWHLRGAEPHLLLEWCAQAVGWWHWAECLAQFWESGMWPAQLTSVEWKYHQNKKFYKKVKGDFPAVCVFYLLGSLDLLYDLCGNPRLDHSRRGTGIRHTVTWVEGTLWKIQSKKQFVFSTCRDPISSSVHRIFLIIQNKLGNK